MLDVLDEIYVEPLRRTCLSILQKHFCMAGQQSRGLTASVSQNMNTISIGGLCRPYYVWACDLPGFE